MSYLNILWTIIIVYHINDITLSNHLKMNSKYIKCFGNVHVFSKEGINL